jgi:hypothetical protein
MIKKFYLLAILLAGFALHGKSQNITNYNFAAYSGTFTNITGGNYPSAGGGTSDEGYGTGIPIGFDFWYMGVRYTTISASTNGWISFGGDITNATPVNNLTSGGSPRPIIAPLWDDLDVQSTNNVTYVTTGTAGSRIFTIQYLNAKWKRTASGSTMSFQVRLYEGTGKIVFTYRQEASSLNAPSASIGISAIATGSGNFLSVNNAGTSVSSTTEASVTSKPITGNNYSFTPPVPTTPGSLTFSGVTSTSMTLNWSDLSSNETGFLIYRSTDGVNYALVTQTAAAATTSAQTGLTTGTLYYWKVYAVSEGALSATALSGTQAAMCVPPAAPGVTSPVAYCQNATAIQLTATGTNLLWGGAAGSVGGTSALTTASYIDNSNNNRKTNFTTTTGNVIITTVDYYVPSYQSVNGLVLSIYNSSGTVIATSTTNTTLSAGASVAKINNAFNYTLVAAGDYSIGVSAGSGNIGSDNPAFPISEVTGTINVTGVLSTGTRCFNNIQFTIPTIATAPVPSTTTAGAHEYFVSQTVGGCTSALSTVVVNVTSVDISQVPSSNLIANYKFNSNANDASGNNIGTLQNSPTQTADRFGVANKAYTFDGSSQYVSTANVYVAPADFTISIWFKTNTVTGGRLIGFGNAQTGSSGNYDRHIYMNNTGQIYFGVYPNAVVTINSPLSYNDNNWHLATASLSASTGMALYVDGVNVASNTGNTTAQNYTGYWRIGYDNNSGWTSQPSDYYFTGSLDDALIYSRALTAAEVTTIYNSPDGAGNNGPTCSGSPISLSATTLSGATYAWTGPNSFSSAVQNPTFSFTTAGAGIYTLNATIAGCTATAYTIVTATTNTGQWTGNVSTDWSNAGNWCTGAVPTAATNVVIASTATRMPSVISSVSCNNLTINAGATVTTSIAGTLNISGTLVNSGTMTNSGTTNFNGTAGQQTFSGVSTFYNLTLNNAGGLLLPAAITVNGNLLISAGTLNANNFGIIANSNWTNNVSATAFTPGTAIVTFSGTTAQVIGGTFSTTFNNLTVASIASVVTLNANATVTGNLSVSSGTFDLAGFTANRASAGGTLVVANNATLKIGGTNTFPANYTAITLVVASTVEYSGVSQTVSNQLYGNLTLSSSVGAAVKTFPATALNIAGNFSSKPGSGTSVTFTAASNITVNGIDSIGASTTFNGGSFSHSIGGNWVNNGTFNGNTGTITFAGPGTTVSGSGAQNFNNLTVSASFVSFSNSNINVSGNLSTISSGSLTQASGGTLAMTGTGKTISGTGISLDNLTISGTVSMTISLVLTGNLSVSGSFASTIGTITMSGTAKTITGAGTKSFGSLLIAGSVTANADFTISSNLVVNGILSASAGTATFTGTTTLSGVANLFNTTINGTSLQLSANATLGIANVMTISSGTLNVISSAPNTVNFNGTSSQNINAITYSKLILSNGNTKSAVGAFTTNSDITIATGTTFNPGAYTHSVYGNWINSGTFTAGTSTIQFLGSATAYVTGATTFNILTSNTSSTTTQLILNNNVSAAIVNMTKGVIATGSNTLTITNTRTGTGYIYGNIQHTHAFTTGMAYAFEGPDNTITFSAVSAVTSITVSVVQSAAGDFPFGGSISRVYNVSVPTGTYTATLRLHYEDGELNGNNEAAMSLWNYNGSTWTAIGKTANSTTANYVEQSGLANITNRWTCSDDANVVQWNGSVSTDWNTAANWTVIQGSVSRPPAATDIVQLGTVAFTNQPIISSTVSVKTIIFGSVQPVNLSMASGGSLTSGDIQGTWSSNVTHVINVNNQTVNVNGDLTLSDGVAGHSINLNIGSGIVNIGDAIIQSGGANVVFNAAGNLNIAGNYQYVSGTFTRGTGTVTYNGVNNQHVAYITYNNLTINKAAAIATIDSIANVAGNLLIFAGQLDNSSTTTIAGNVTIASGTTFNNNSILHVGGNWVNNGSYTSIGASIFFDGTGTQTISASTFNNLIVNKPVGSSAILTGNVLMNGDLTVTSGTLNIKSFTCDRTVTGGLMTLGDSATFIVGANNAPAVFSSGAISNSSTVIADGTSPQYIYSGTNFGNLILRNAGVKTLVTNLTINGDLTIESGATFDGGANTISLNGNWIDSGTFTPSASTIICTGTSKNIAGNNIFNRFSVYGSYTFLNNNTINSLLIINPSGSLSGGSTITTIMNGDLINKGILYTLGTTTYTGNVVQSLSLLNAIQTVAITVNFNGSVSPVLNSTSAPQYGYLNINNTGGVNPSVGWNVLYALTVGSGASFNCGASTHNFYGAVTNNGTMTSSGILNFIPTSTATVNLGTHFTSTGRVIFGGAGAMTLAGNSLDSFHNVVISNTNGAGISPSFNWNISNNFTVNSGSLFNAGSQAYLVGGKISNSGTINSGTSTFTLNGSATQDIYSLSPFNNLTVNNTANSVTLSSNATVNGVLNFVAGSIQTGSNLLIQPSAGTITGAAQNTGWVNGKLRKNIATGATTKPFEIGDAASYTPVSLAFSNVTTAGNLTAITTPGDHPQIVGSGINPSKSVNRFWTLTNSGIGFTNYTATYNFVPADIDAGASTAGFSVANYIGSAWSFPVTASPNPTNIQATGVTLFGDFAIGESCNMTTKIAYTASTYCSSGGTASVTLTGNGGGTYSSATGLSLNTSTGSVNLSASSQGSYIVNYAVAAAGGCPSFLTTANIIVTSPPSATISYDNNPYCSSKGTAAITRIGTAGGTFSSADSLVINALTGSVNLATSAAGTYTVTYTVAASGGCSLYTTTTGITVTTQPFATGTYEGNPYCTTGGIAFPTGIFAGALGTLTSTAGLSIDPPTGVIDLAASVPGTYTLTYTVPASGGCALYTNTGTVSIVLAGTWTGAVSSNWNDAGNWLCGEIPGSATNVLMDSSLAIYPVVTSTGAINKITIQPGGLITVSGGTLQIADSIINHGTFNAVAGTIEMNGTAAQTIPANTFLSNAVSNFIVSNSSATGITLGGPLDIYGSLTYSGTGRKLATNDNLTLKSNATYTAWLGNMTGNTITGKVTVERYLSSRKAWRFLSVPTNTNQTIQQTWQEGASTSASNPVAGYGIQITGAGGTAAGFDVYSAAPSMKTYNSVTNVWEGVPNTNATGIKATTGYMVFMRGDRTITSPFASPTQTTLRTKGTLYTGNQTPIAAGSGQFTSIGNPYPSVVDMRTITKTGVKDFFYLWDAALAGGNGYGGYQTFSNNGSGNYVVTPGGDSYGAIGSFSNDIQSGQAFLVQGNIGGGSLTFKETAKTTGSGVVSVPSLAPAPQIRANLYGVNADNSTYMADGVLINYGDNYSDSVDDFDAIKLANTAENLSIKVDNVLLVIERRHTITGLDTVFLNLTGVKVQQYRFEFTAEQLYQPGLTGFLEDSYLHTRTPLNIDGSTIVNFNMENIPGCYAADRFRIVFGQMSPLPVTFTSIKAYPSDNGIEVAWNVENEINIEQYEVEKSIDGTLFTKIAVIAATANIGNSASYQVTDTKPVEGNNYYRIKSVDLDGATAYSNVVKVLIGVPSGEILVYPNPLSNGTIRLQLNKLPSGNYGLRLLNEQGQVMITKQINHAEGSNTENIPLNKYIPHGIYQLEVTRPDGSKTNINVIY